MHHLVTHRTITATLAVVCLLLASCGSTPDGEEQADAAASNQSNESSPQTSGSADATTPTTESSTTTAPPSTVSTTEAPAQEPTELATVLDVGGGARELAADLYVDQALTSIGQLDLVESIDVLFYEDSILITRDASLDDEVLGEVIFMAPFGVMPPEQAGIHQPHEPPVPDTAVPVPDDLGAWLESIEQVEITSTGSVDVAAGSATWYDFIVSDGAQTFDCGFHPTCIGLVAMPGGVWVYLTGEQYRLYQVDTLPGLLVVARTTPEDSATVFARSDEVVAGLGTRG